MLVTNYIQQAQEPKYVLLCEIQTRLDCNGHYIEFINTNNCKPSGIIAN